MTTQTAIGRHANEADIVLPADLVETACNYPWSAHAKRTQAAYARVWESFAAWCAKRRLQAQPAAPETVAR
jgi:hypothetical protein